MKQTRKSPHFFGADSIAGLMLFSNGGLDGDNLTRQAEKARDEALRLIDYVLPLGGETKSLPLPLRAVVTLKALKKDGINPEIDTIYANLEKIFSEDHGQAVDGYESMVTGEAFKNELNRMKNFQVAARRISIDEFQLLQEEMKLTAPLPIDGIRALMEFSGIDNDYSIRHIAAGKIDYAYVDLKNEDVAKMEKLLAEHDLKGTSHTNPSMAGRTKFFVNLEPLTRDRSATLHTTRVITQSLNRPPGKISVV